ncbi:hypothetical protein JW851_02545 [Candidatus Woesearchaeota archaeon]|nr:hypothetical protein [Candidatus Woesearchaeota archaeon]
MNLKDRLIENLLEERKQEENPFYELGRKYSKNPSQGREIMKKIFGEYCRICGEILVEEGISIYNLVNGQIPNYIICSLQNKIALNGLDPITRFSLGFSMGVQEANNETVKTITNIIQGYFHLGQANSDEFLKALDKLDFQSMIKLYEENHEELDAKHPEAKGIIDILKEKIYKLENVNS